MGTTTSAPQPPEPGYIRPEFRERMVELRPVILAAARRHNRPALSHMSDSAFAEVIALILYNEHNGWFEDALPTIRVFTPWYQRGQIVLNKSGVGSNFSVWPANLRPSVALEILRQELPMQAASRSITVPVTITGGGVDPGDYRSTEELFAAITDEIARDEMAVEYLAANLERGLYRSSYEGAPMSWRTLAAWHNQGIVHPDAIRANTTAQEYVRRSAAYLEAAQQLIAAPGS